jgi:hypothetical protein
LKNWAFARVALGLSTEEFWALEQRQWYALLDEWKVQQKTLDRRAALIACIIANSHKVDEKTFDIEEFMPTYTTEQGQHMTAEQMQRKVLALHAAITGEDRSNEINEVS